MEPGRKKHILAWLIFGLLSIPYLMVYFHRVAPAVVADRLMGGFLGAAIMQPLLGCALDRKWNGVTEGGARVYPLEAFHSAFTIALVILVLTSIWIFLIRETYGEMKP